MTKMSMSMLMRGEEKSKLPRWSMRADIMPWHWHLHSIRFFGIILLHVVTSMCAQLHHDVTWDPISETTVTILVLKITAFGMSSSKTYNSHHRAQHISTPYIEVELLTHRCVVPS